MKKLLSKISLVALIAAMGLITGCGSTETNDSQSSPIQSESSSVDSSIDEGSSDESSSDEGTVTECEHSGGEATCTEAAICEKCGEPYGEKLDHSYESVVTAPTCTEAGYTTYTCACGDTYTGDEVAATGHNHESVVTAPTCTEAGYTTYTCACGDTYTGDEVAATGHTFIDSKCECGADYVAPEGTSWTLVTDINNGDHVLIGAPAYGKLLSAEKVSSGSYYNKGVDYTIENFDAVTDAEIFVVTVNADNSYTFTSLTGDVIALADSYSSLNATGKNKSWVLEDKGNGLFLMKNTVRGNYLEWYNSKNNWSAYTNPTTKEFELSFYSKQEAAEDHVHNHISEVHAVTCTEDGYTSYTCKCGDTYKVDGEKATGHSYETTVVAPTCTEDGYTSHVCGCGDSYVTDETAATGHTFVDGKCACGEEEQTGPAVTTGSADLNAIALPSNKANGDSSYTATYTSANGWVSKNSAIQCGGATILNPQFPVIGADNTSKAVCLNGKVSAPGSLTSPTLNGGLSKLTVKYTKMFTDTKLSVTITVTEISSGKTYTHDITVELPKDEKYVVYTDEWVLETPVSGDFTIEFKNNCPSKATGNKDRMTILSVDWVGAAAVHTHEYTSTTTATCTAAGVTTYTCECGDTYTEETGILDHVDTNLDITCDFEGCTKRILPAADRKVSLFTANAMIVVSLSSNYYVEGVVTEVTDAKNGMFIITDEAGDTLLVRMPKDENGNLYSTWTTYKVCLGDTLKVYGKPTKNTGAPAAVKAKIEGGLITVLKHEHNFSAVTCTEDAVCGCLTVGDKALGHINENGDNLCDRCEWNLNLKIANIAITTDTTLSNGVQTMGTDGKAAAWTWSDENFDVVIAKGTSTVTLYTTAKAYMQLKKLNTFTLTNKNGKMIKSVTLSTTNATQLTNLVNALANNGLTFTKDEAALTVTIEWNSTNDLTFKNNGTQTAYISGAEIIYE